MNPTPEAQAEARNHPGGHVYAIEGVYGPNDHVPPEAIKGAWAVDANGEITGDFIPNPNYRANQNPYESPKTTDLAGEGGTRLMTIAVVLMLILLTVVCGILAVAAYYIQGLG